MRRIIIAALLLSTAALGQTGTVAVDTSAMPSPATAVPSPDMLGGAIGVSNRYMRADSVRPRNSRSVNGTIAGGNGFATVTWPTPFVSASPVPLGIQPVNATSTTAMITCNFTAISQTGATVRCTQPLVSLSISLGALTLLPAAANGLVVGITAIEPSS